MKENFPNLVKEIDMQSRKHRVPNKVNPKRPTPRHIIIKMPKVKDKERILKGQKSSMYRAVPIRLSAVSQKKFFGLEGIGKKYSVMKSRNLHPRLLYPAKISFRIQGQIKSFPDLKKKKNLKVFINSKPLLYEMLKGLI